MGNRTLFLLGFGSGVAFVVGLFAYYAAQGAGE